MAEEIKIKRGRPKGTCKSTFSVNKSLEDQEDAVITKIWQGEPLTLNETALAIWMSEGRKSKKPLSNVTILNYEHSALQKIKIELEKIGIHCTADCFGDVFAGYKTQSSLEYNPRLGSVD